MALSRDYRRSVHGTVSPSHHPKTAFSAHAGSSSSSSSTHQSRLTSAPQHTFPPLADVPMEGRRRRGRQARPSQLSKDSQRACKTFSNAVGPPQVVVPAGFRDFRGWLSALSSPQCRHLWNELLATVAKDVNCNADAMHGLKEDIVREIIKCVVIPRLDESAKLVSTNAGRQASHPRSGTTLMVVLEDQLARVEKRLPQLVASVNTSSSSEPHANGMTEIPSQEGRKHGRHRGSSNPSPRSQSTTDGERHSGKLPSVSDILSNRRASSSSRSTLPSFQELEASLQKRGSSSRR